MRKSLFTLFALLAGLSVSLGQTGTTAPKFACPVAGFSKIDDKCGCTNDYCSKKATSRVTVEYSGQRVMLCCSLCVGIFKKDPDKFATNANHQLASRGLAKQTKCPICGEKTTEGNGLEVVGVTVQTASADCKKKAEAGKVREQIDRLFGKKAFESAFEVAAVKK